MAQGFNSEILTEHEEYPDEEEYTLDNAPLRDLVLNFDYEDAVSMYSDFHNDEEDIF